MPDLNISINNRQLACQYPLKDELVFDKNKNYIFNLEYLNVLNVLGEKSAEFLQGQLTADILSVNQQNSIPSAMCNIKGRIIALLNVVYWNNLLLILPCDLIDQVQKTLKKTALFSKVTIEKNNRIQVYGFYLQNPEDKIPFNASLPTEEYQAKSNELYCCYKITANLYVFLIDKIKTDKFQEDFPKSARRSEFCWHNLLLKSGNIDIYPDSSALFLPQRLSLHDTKYLNFKKGCYLGQEIIARMHYRSKAKHAMQLYLTKIPQKIYAGQKLYDSETEAEIGEIIDFSFENADHCIIAVSVLFKHSNTVNFENAEGIYELCKYGLMATPALK